MKIRIRVDAAERYLARQYANVPASCGSRHNPEWVKTLEAIAGKWIHVDTTHLFHDQFNTTSIPGVSKNGLRIMVQDIDKIWEDVRAGVIKCRWCFGIKQKDGVCCKCGKSEYLHPLNPVSP